MTAPTPGWHRGQSEHSRGFHELVQAACPDKYHDWKVNPLFYSGLHRANYWFAKHTGRAPESHFERNRRVGRDLPQVFDDYKSLYVMSMQARYREGFRVADERRHSAYVVPCRVEAMLPL